MTIALRTEPVAIDWAAILKAYTNPEQAALKSKAPALDAPR
jgi:hypothetical protein